MQIYVQGGSGLFCGEDEESKTSIIWACEEEISRYPSEKVREARYSGYDER